MPDQVSQVHFCPIFWRHAGKIPEPAMKSAECSPGEANPEPLSARFGKHLREWRRSNDLPQKALATDLGVSKEVVSDWERGIRFPCQRHLAMIASHTGRPLCSFFRQGQCRCMQGEAQAQ